MKITKIWSMQSIMILQMLTSFNQGLRKQLQRTLNEKLLAKAANGEAVTDTDPNTFIDQTLVMINEIIQAKHLDPYEIINADVLDVYVEAWIGGYSSLYRQGDASITKTSDTITISCAVGLHTLAANGSIQTSFLGIPFYVSSTATVESVSVSLTLRFVKDPTTGDVSGYVDEFQVTDIGLITVDVFGLGPLDYLADAIADVIANIVKYFIPVLFDGIFTRILQDIIDAILGGL